MLVVGEAVDRLERDPARLVQPAQVAGRDVELVQAVREVRVVVEEPGAGRTPRSAGADDLAVDEQLGELDRLREHVVAVEHPPGFRQRGEREPVPRRDHLVVARRLRALLADCEQAGAQLVVELAAEDEAAVLERLQQLLGRALARRPGERQPLDAVGVRVLRRREPLALDPELAEQVVDRALGDVAVRSSPVTAQPCRYAGTSSALS